MKKNSRESVVRRVYTIACGLFLSVALVGCVDPAPQDGVSNQDVGPATIVEVQTDIAQGDEATNGSPKSPETIVQDAAPPAGPPTVAAVTPVPPVAAPVPEKPAIDDNPERLMGLGAGELTLMLGSPRFVRRDSSAQLWRYRNKSCILDLFLYRDAGRPEFFVSHIEARRAEGGAALKRKCFGALLLEQRDREAG